MTVLLSALNDGFVLSKPGALKRIGSAPGAVDTTQISFTRVFFASITDVTCTATNFPSGLIVGEPTVLTLYQSLVSNARLVFVCGERPAIGLATTSSATPINAARMGSTERSAE